jgi:predicted  nucleic acid-binding Zn-ribbon protein
MKGSTKRNTRISTISRLTAVQHTMHLTKNDRAKITDSMHSIQSAQASLTSIDETKVPQVNEIQDCLESADKNLRIALRQASAKKKPLA